MKEKKHNCSASSQKWYGCWSFANKKVTITKKKCVMVRTRNAEACVFIRSVWCYEMFFARIRCFHFSRRHCVENTLVRGKRSHFYLYLVIRWIKHLFQFFFWCKEKKTTTKIQLDSSKWNWQKKISTEVSFFCCCCYFDSRATNGHRPTSNTKRVLLTVINCLAKCRSHSPVMRTKMMALCLNDMNDPGIQPEVNRNDNFKLQTIYEWNLFWRFELKLYAFESFWDRISRLG